LEKKSFEDKKTFKMMRPCCAVGDLVKIKSSSWAGRAEDSIGLIVRETGDVNIGLFPDALVYDMRRQKVMQFYLYDLELISTCA
jgi:hypothetical protein